MELGRVTDYQPDSIGHWVPYVDRFCHCLPEHPGHFVDKVQRLKQNSLAFDAPGKLQHLLDHIAAPLCVLTKYCEKALALGIGKPYLEHSHR